MSLVLPLAGEERLAAGDVGEPRLDRLAVHVHGEVVEGGRHQALLHLADHSRLLRLLQLQILWNFRGRSKGILSGFVLSGLYCISFHTGNS